MGAKYIGNFPKCESCVDSYCGKCNCQQSEFYGMGTEGIPWDGCRHFLSQRKWGGYDKPKKKRKKPKWPSLEEFEFGV